MRRKPTSASIIALLALFVALGGTAIAANHYIITSANQIKPSVLKSLRAHVGRAGPTGAAGETGETGPDGPRRIQRRGRPSGSHRLRRDERGRAGAQRGRR